MKQRPGADALLEAALITLQEDLLPSLSGRQKYLAAMVARAISVAPSSGVSTAAYSANGRGNTGSAALPPSAAQLLAAQNSKPATASHTRILG